MHGGSGTRTALLAKRSYEGPDQDAEDDMDPDTPPRFSRAQLRSMFQVSLSLSLSLSHVSGLSLSLSHVSGLALSLSLSERHRCAYTAALHVSGKHCAGVV